MTQSISSNTIAALDALQQSALTSTATWFALFALFIIACVVAVIFLSYLEGPPPYRTMADLDAARAYERERLERGAYDLTEDWDDVA